MTLRTFRIPFPFLLPHDTVRRIGGNMRFFVFTALFLSSFSWALETIAPGKVLGGSALVDKSMNPAISINGLFLGSYGTAQEKHGLRIQEIETQFTAAVDPYFLGNFIIAIEGDGAIEVEEAFMSTLSLPRVTLKAGKFYTNFGSNNRIHTHAQSFIERPLVNKTLLGEEGFNSFGMEASVLIPTPWYMDLTVGGVNGSTTPMYTSESDASLVLTSRLENLFELSDQTTLSFGLSYSTGDNQTKNMSHYFGADSTLKYVSGKGRGEFAVVWTNEIIASKRTGYQVLTTPEWETGWGAYSTLLARLSTQFWVGGRFDYLSTHDFATTSAKGENLIIAFVPSEFSAIRLQGGLLQPVGGGKTQWQALAQYIMTIGSHPAHAY